MEQDSCALNSLDRDKTKTCINKDPSAALEQAMEDDLPQQTGASGLGVTVLNAHHSRRHSKGSNRIASLMKASKSVTEPTVTVSEIEASSFPIYPANGSEGSLRALLHHAEQPDTSGQSTKRPNWSSLKGKQIIDPLLDPSDQAETVEQEVRGIRNKYKTPKHPLVFCHGLLGFDSIKLAAIQIPHWWGITEVLKSNGIEFLVTRVPATSSIEERAKVLQRTISEIYPDREIHLIAHSMGGLDCRYLTSRLERSFKVLSVTTISTPHRGSSVIDYVMKTIGQDRVSAMLSLLQWLPKDIGDGKAIEALTTENMRRFNEETPDLEGVQYFSWGAAYQPGLLDAQRWPHSFIFKNEGPNDGTVSVESSKWGIYLGTLENVSHIDLVGWTNRARYQWAKFRGTKIRFKPATFYLELADFLANVVEEA